MRQVALTVTEAARNFADCINRARYQGTTFLLRKNGVAVARIVPEERKPASAQEFSAALALVRPSEDEMTAWRSDLAAARARQTPEVAPWP